MRRDVGLLAAVLVAALPLASGCKSKPDKICANLEAIIAKEAPEKPLSTEDRAKCVADIQAELDQCQNVDTIAACYAEATSIDAIATCESKCQRKPGKPARPRSSASPVGE